MWKRHLRPGCRSRRKVYLCGISLCILVFWLVSVYQLDDLNMTAYWLPRGNDHNANSGKTDDDLIKRIDRIYDTVASSKSRGSRKNATSSQTTLSQDTNTTTDHFVAMLSDAERQIAYELLSTLHHVMTSSNLTYWIYSGTLLGSYRHHDLIPWDDDVDVITDVDTKDLLIERLQELPSKFGLFTGSSRLKFFDAFAEKTSRFPWTFPFIDISFYKDNGTSLLYDYSDHADMGDFMYVFEKRTIFPLHLRPIGTLFVYSPRDSYAHLLATYRDYLNVCQAPHYTHRNESLIGNELHTVECSALRHRVPFVHRKAVDMGVVETLMLDQIKLHEVVVSEPLYAITDPFSLRLVHV